MNEREDAERVGIEISPQRSFEAALEAFKSLKTLAVASSTARREVSTYHAERQQISDLRFAQ